MEQIVVDFMPPRNGHADGSVLRKDNVVSNDVSAVFVPHVRMKRVGHHDVVLGNAMKSLAELQATGQHKIVINAVVAGTVVEIDVPTVVTPPATVADDVDVDHVQLCQFRKLFDRSFLQPPESIAAPGIEAAVVASFEDGVEDIAEFNHVSAECSFVDVDAGSGNFINRTVSHGDVAGHGDLNAGRLFLTRPVR